MNVYRKATGSLPLLHDFFNFVAPEGGLGFLSDFTGVKPELRLTRRRRVGEGVFEWGLFMVGGGEGSDDQVSSGARIVNM